MTQPTEDGQTPPEQEFKCPACGKIVEEPTLCEECLDKKNRREKVAIEGILSMVAENKSNGVLTADQKTPLQGHHRVLYGRQDGP